MLKNNDNNNEWDDAASNFAPKEKVEKNDDESATIEQILKNRNIEISEQEIVDEMSDKLFNKMLLDYCLGVAEKIIDGKKLRKDYEYISESDKDFILSIEEKCEFIDFENCRGKLDEKDGFIYLFSLFKDTEKKKLISELFEDDPKLDKIAFL